MDEEDTIDLGQGSIEVGGLEMVDLSSLAHFLEDLEQTGTNDTIELDLTRL
ncbi:MAG TPA: hypothetical protein VKR06_02425 [Ktedonosporobacter sp.]|nr:hypothetical protein [Ktedonosporobacter sp.]